MKLLCKHYMDLHDNSICISILVSWQEPRNPNTSLNMSLCCSIFKKYRMAGMPDEERDLKRGEKFYNHGIRSVSTMIVEMFRHSKPLEWQRPGCTDTTQTQ